MRIAILGILAGLGLAMASVPAAAQSTAPVEARLYRGATVSMENGVRVIRPVTASSARYAPDYRRVYIYDVREVSAHRFAMFDSVPRNLREIGTGK